MRSPRWSVGVAWYGGDMLLWYRGLSLSVRPQERLCRAELQVESRRSPSRDDLALPSDVVVLTSPPPEGPRELAMDSSTVTGFLSWVESAPPAADEPAGSVGGALGVGAAVRARAPTGCRRRGWRCGPG